MFVENLIVLDLDDKFDLVLGKPWLARHDPVVNWEKRAVVRFGRNATESDGPVSVAHAPQGASDHTVEAVPNAAAFGAQAQVATTDRVVECESNPNLIGSDLPRESSDECVGVDVASSHELEALHGGPVRWTHQTDMHPFGSRKYEERSGGVEATPRCEYR
ncbi:hypothetical protein PI125_g24492 [Phytophthora idaei]|nr:hypothetical protein PI125_g24492 [Phytophthora idaei]